MIILVFLTPFEAHQQSLNLLRQLLQSPKLRQTKPTEENSDSTNDVDCSSHELQNSDETKIDIASENHEVTTSCPSLVTETIEQKSESVESKRPSQTHFQVPDQTSNQTPLQKANVSMPTRIISSKPHHLPPLQHIPVRTTIPSHFLCQLTGEIMSDPVRTPQGIVYDYSSIVDHLRSHNTTGDMNELEGECPITNEALKLDNLTPDTNLTEEIELWKFRQRFGHRWKLK